MDDKNMNRLLMQKAGKKFYGHDVLYSKYIPQIPASAEREYVRLVDRYMGILKSELEGQLPKLKESYKMERDTQIRENRRNDGLADFLLSLAGIFNTIKNRIISRTEGFGLRRKLENMAHLNRKLTVKEWKKAVKSTLAVDITEDYYLGDFYSEQLVKWVDENVSLIKTIPEDTLDKMREIIYDGYTTGKTTTRMAKDIQNAYRVGKRHAEFIARDQTAKLNGQIQRAQQTDAGITEYLWYSCMDGRVRNSHKALHGKKFRWDDPPENSDGRKCHPGQDFQCRCIARPVFNRRTLNLPLAGEGDRSIGKDTFDMNIESMKEKGYNIPQAADLSCFPKMPVRTTRNQDAVLSNINFGKGEGFITNCQRCVPAYELRRRGYDVTALPKPDSELLMGGLWRNIFEKAEWKECGRGSGLDVIEKAMKIYGDGSRAEVYVRWRKTNSSHVFVAEQIDGKTEFIDPQTGETDVKWYFDDVEHGATEFCRIDHLEPSQYIHVCCEKYNHVEH